MIPKTEEIAQKRIENAFFYDNQLSLIPGITIPPRPVNYKIVYHLYMVFAERRDELLEFCLKNGIEAKVHYPIPIYRQPALNHLGNELGKFPVSDRHAATAITFPCDQHLTQKELQYVVDVVKAFYLN